MTHPPGNESPRRGFLKHIALASSALPVVAGSALGLAPGAVSAAPAAVPAVNNVFGYQSLGPDEAAFVETLLNVMCPADAHTPNGVDCGLAIYIDRQLAGSFGQGARRYLRGPFQAGVPAQGEQSPMTPEQHFKAGVAGVDAALKARGSAPLSQLAPAQVDAVLHELAEGRLRSPALNLQVWFNELLYPLFTEACFADPLYGGNFNKVFWKLIGFPGLPATHTLDMVQYRGKPYPGAQNPQSIADFS